MLNDLPDVLTVTEAAALLRIGKNKAYELINSGALPHFRLGRKILPPKRKLAELLENAAKNELGATKENGILLEIC